MHLIIFSLLIGLFFISSFFPSDILTYLIGVIANLAIIFAIFHARGLYLISGIVFYLIGFIIFLTSGLAWQEFFFQFDTMLPIVTFFFLIPFLNSLIIVGRYDKHLSSLLNFNVKNLGDLYGRNSIVSHSLGLFLNIATIPIIMQSLRATLKNLPAETLRPFYTKSILRAYGLCLMWSPMEVLIIFTLDLTNNEYIVIFPILITITGTMFIFNWFYGKRKYHDIPLNTESKDLDIRFVLRKIAELGAFLVFLVVCVSIFNKITNHGYMLSLITMIIPVSLIWSLILRRSRHYVKHSIVLWKNRSDGLANYFCMFLSAGFFINMIAYTPVLSILQNYFTYVGKYTILLFISISIYFQITSLSGFHPVVSIFLLAEVLTPSLSDVASLSLATVIIISSLSTVIYSPFNISVSILAGELNINPYRIAWWNLPYIFILLGLTISFAYVLQLII